MRTRAGAHAAGAVLSRVPMASTPERAAPARPRGLLGWSVFAWGIGGVVLLLAQALARLAPLAWEAVQAGLSGLQWTILAVWVVANAHAEGYRGFHRRFSPRVVARALHLSSHPRGTLVLLAPLYCMSLVHASRRGLIVARVLVLAIVLLVVSVRMLDQPWRGIVDAGVVVGLGIGTLSLLGFVALAIAGRPPAIDPDLPPAEPTR
jgi:hypothetical protein